MLLSKILSVFCSFFVLGTCLHSQQIPNLPNQPQQSQSQQSQPQPQQRQAQPQVVEKLSELEAIELATEAYIYGYPLITMDLTRQVMTNVAEPQNRKSPMGQFMNARTYPDASFKEVTAPNADTLYSIAWLDLAKEPYILHVPEENGRYYLMPMLSGWTDVFASPGTRTTGTAPANFAITGPSWKGTLPEGVKELKSPTSMVWLIGRTYCTGAPDDYTAVHEIQDQYSLVPLSSYGKPYTPPKGMVNPNIDMKTPVRSQVNHMDAATYFKRLAALLVDNPPSILDAAMVEKLARLGIVAGKDVDFTKLDPIIASSLKLAPKIALEEIMSLQDAQDDNVNGWHVPLNTGLYGTNYLTRAYVTAIGLGANRPQDAIYPYTSRDSDGKHLNGKNRYVLHFEKDQLPPVKGFWSLTMYNDQYFFVENPLNRYTVSPRNQLKINADGSIDLYIQHDSPGKDLESNWLPAPEHAFILMFRLYWPNESILNGTWKPPAVQKVKLTK